MRICLWNWAENRWGVIRTALDDEDPVVSDISPAYQYVGLNPHIYQPDENSNVMIKESSILLFHLTVDGIRARLFPFPKLHETLNTAFPQVDEAVSVWFGPTSHDIDIADPWSSSAHDSSILVNYSDGPTKLYSLTRFKSEEGPAPTVYLPVLRQLFPNIQKQHHTDHIHIQKCVAKVVAFWHAQPHVKAHVIDPHTPMSAKYETLDRSLGVFYGEANGIQVSPWSGAIIFAESGNDGEVRVWNFA